MRVDLPEPFSPARADDLGWEDLEVDAVERLHARKALCDGAEFDQGFGHGVRFDFRTGTTFGMNGMAIDRDGRPLGRLVDQR